MGSQDDETSAFSFHIDQPLSPPPELGASHVSRTHQVFDMGPDSEPEGEEEGEEGARLGWGYLHLVQAGCMV